MWSLMPPNALKDECQPTQISKASIIVFKTNHGSCCSISYSFVYISPFPFINSLCSAKWECQPQGSKCLYPSCAPTLSLGSWNQVESRKVKQNRLLITSSEIPDSTMPEINPSALWYCTSSTPHPSSFSSLLKSEF